MDIEVKKKETSKNIEVTIAFYIYLNNDWEPLPDKEEKRNLESMIDLQNLVNDISQYNKEQQQLYDSGKTIYLRMKKILSK